MTHRTADTLSSLAYLGDAAIAFTVGLPLPGIGFTALGIGSSLFHWYEPAILEGDDSKKWAQRLDEVGMYLAFVPLMILSLNGDTALLITAAAFFALLYDSLNSFLAMPSIIGIGLIAYSLNFGIVPAAILTCWFTTAVIAREYIHHSIWHLLSAGAAALWILGLAL